MQFQLVIAAILAFTFAVPISAMNGFATWYNQYGVAGSCGEYHADTDYVAAVSPDWGHNALCGRYANVWYNGRYANVRIVDTCYACTENDLDLSPEAFDVLADPDAGKIWGVEWDLI